ncbi:unnamed protein product, partial [Mesorhabditis spiculigera]
MALNAPLLIMDAADSSLDQKTKKVQFDNALFAKLEPPVFILEGKLAQHVPHFLAVRSKDPKAGRSFATKSGIERNKSFGRMEPYSETEEQDDVDQYVPLNERAGPISVKEEKPPTPLYMEPQRAGCIAYTGSPKNPYDVSAPSSVKSLFIATPSDACVLNSGPATPLPAPLPKTNTTSIKDPLQLLIQEEMRLGERRRIIFCDRPVDNLLGQNQHSPYTKEEIRPLVFQEFRRSMRTHILFMYEWLQAWPDYATLSNKDKVSFLRKCVLLHTILDPVYISLQCGWPDKFVMQNGGYVSCKEDCDDGWRDEKEISSHTKKMIYKPLLERIMQDIMKPLLQFGITFEEFVALKGLVSFQGAIENVSAEGRPVLKCQLDGIISSLHKFYLERGEPPAERLGSIILLLSSILTAGLDWVESHRTIEFFDLWDLDSLLRQLLNLDAIFQKSLDQ